MTQSDRKKKYRGSSKQCCAFSGCLTRVADPIGNLKKAPTPRVSIFASHHMGNWRPSPPFNGMMYEVEPLATNACCIGDWGEKTKKLQPVEHDDSDSRTQRMPMR